MKQIFGKSFIIFLSLIFASCAAKNEQQSRIRIVDLDGKSHPVITKIPELNKQAMASQGVFKEQSETFQNNLPEEPKQNSAPQALASNTPDYGAVSSEIIQNTLQPKRPTEQQEAMVSGGKQSDEAVEYDLSKPEEDAKPQPKLEEKKSAKKHEAATKVEKGLFVQVGSFSSVDNAKKTLVKMKKFHKGRVETVEGEKTIYRVLLGPFTSKPKALAMVKKITNSGHEAVLMRNK